MTRVLTIFMFVSASMMAIAQPTPAPSPLQKGPFTMPTQKGSTWVYEEGGKEKTLVITRSETKGDSKIVTTEWVKADGKRSPHMVVEVSDKGVFLIEETGLKYDAPWCILKLPYREGQQWETKAKIVKIGLDMTGTMTSGSVEKKQVPGGLFYAVPVKWAWDSKKPNEVFTCWYAHGIGLIQKDDDLKLKSFKPGQD